MHFYRLTNMFLFFLGAGSLWCFYCWFASAWLPVHDGSEQEKSWQAAWHDCTEQGQRLATISELAGLMIRGELQARKTDYWSATRIGSYAFGVNMKSHILSFDRQDDSDHFVCIPR